MDNASRATTASPRTSPRQCSSTSPSLGPGASPMLDVPSLQLAPGVVQDDQKQPPQPMTPCERLRLVRVLHPSLYGRIELVDDAVTGVRCAVKKSSWSERRKCRSTQRACPYLEDPVQECVVLRHIPPHRHILPLLDELHDKEFHYTVVPFAPGGDLLDYILDSPKGRLPAAEVQVLFRQLVQGVRHLHQHRVCHLDLSCENILLDDNGNLLITDFGQARVCPHGAHQTWDSPVTRPGKKYYMAPEIVEREPFRGDDCDVFSLGVCLFVMLLGTYPFTRANRHTDQRYRIVRTQGVESLLFQMDRRQYVPDAAVNLLEGLLCTRRHRLTLPDVEQHPFLQQSSPQPHVVKQDVPSTPPSQHMDVDCTPQDMQTEDPDFIDFLL